jgi:hypothetical protein
MIISRGYIAQRTTPSGYALLTSIEPQDKSLLPLVDVAYKLLSSLMCFQVGVLHLQIVVGSSSQGGIKYVEIESCFGGYDAFYDYSTTSLSQRKSSAWYDDLYLVNHTRSPF